MFFQYILIFVIVQYAFIPTCLQVTKFQDSILWKFNSSVFESETHHIVDFYLKPGYCNNKIQLTVI